ncbi:MAG: hypothetical protein EOP02_02010 [Proteobacteria bacterium]|jgi:hypothetical protein|nr:MAG: hypothetical protein EOP02_02010 [Pseudomonadota bacterium]
MNKLQIIVALVWPLLRWLLVLDVTWQFARMVYFWQTPGNHAGWTFLAHFAVLAGLTCFVGVYRPRRVVR